MWRALQAKISPIAPGPVPELPVPELPVPVLAPGIVPGPVQPSEPLGPKRPKKQGGWANMSAEQLVAVLEKTMGRRGLVRALCVCGEYMMPTILEPEHQRLAKACVKAARDWLAQPENTHRQVAYGALARQAAAAQATWQATASGGALSVCRLAAWAADQEQNTDAGWAARQLCDMLTIGEMDIAGLIRMEIDKEELRNFHNYGQR